MDKSELIITILSFSLVGVLLYRKYAKNRQDKSGVSTNMNTDSSFSSHAKDDEYEPYAKK
ncbi:MAG TPA: hypothetical protein PLI41_06320 [Bacteroidales bacterium]|jgi:hypothetical protein|nr:hypothetical protein [Bacteroidales bacterium]HQB37143.1 hypothetical protein [Bacteroidales bacterium]